MAMQPHFLGSMTLKALLEDPNLKNPPILSNDPIKVKKEGDGSELPQFNYGSAFLGPNLWDRSADNSDFNLEYMDLDEFLSENGIPLANDEIKDLPVGKPTIPNINGTPAQMPLPASPRQYLNTSPPRSPPTQYLNVNAPSPSHYTAPPVVNPIQHPSPVNKTPSPPVSPFNVDFAVSEQDLALASIPDYGDESSHYRPKWQAWNEDTRSKDGHDDFDPRKRNFSEEELKPQPILKKSKKVFVPEDLKDDRYWARRHKNNFAAKRSRDARRVKENQIAMRASFLEKENSCLRDEMTKLRKENAKLKAKVAKYEGTSGDGLALQ